MEIVVLIVILGIFYWCARGAYLIYRIISGLMLAVCIGIITVVRYIYNSKRYKDPRKT